MRHNTMYNFSSLCLITCSPNISYTRTSIRWFQSVLTHTRMKVICVVAGHVAGTVMRNVRNSFN